MILQTKHYAETSSPRAARCFLGKALVADSPQGRVVGIISETEAYGPADDAACHAYQNRRTARTDPLFAQGGMAYVYLVYGMYELFNIVTGPANKPMAVLIRAVEIIEGQDLVRERRGPRVKPRQWADGPGKLTIAMGITRRAHNRIDLTRPADQTAPTRLWIEDRDIKVPARAVERTPRIGIDFAGPTWAAKPWRFVWSRAAEAVFPTS